METHCIARFDTLHGPMFLFDASAVKAVLEALPITEFAGGVQLQSSVGSMLDPISFVGSCTPLQGFTIEEWANHARKKSSLASRICKQNGELKAQVASYADSCPKKEEDPVNKLDPWASATFRHNKDIPVAGVDAWSKWTLGGSSDVSDELVDDLQVSKVGLPLFEVRGKNPIEHDGERAHEYDEESIVGDSGSSLHAAAHSKKQHELLEFDEKNGTSDSNDVARKSTSRGVDSQQSKGDVFADSVREMNVEQPYVAEGTLASGETMASDSLAAAADAADVKKLVGVTIEEFKKVFKSEMNEFVEEMRQEFGNMHCLCIIV